MRNTDRLLSGLCELCGEYRIRHAFALIDADGYGEVQGTKDDGCRTQYARRTTNSDTDEHWLTRFLGFATEDTEDTEDSDTGSIEAGDKTLIIDDWLFEWKRYWIDSTLAGSSIFGWKTEDWSLETGGRRRLIDSASPTASKPRHTEWRVNFGGQVTQIDADLLGKDSFFVRTRRATKNEGHKGEDRRQTKSDQIA